MQISSIDLIGQVTTQLLKESINLEESDGSIARFLLDKLTGEQVTNICQKILSDPDLSSCIKIKIPRILVEGYHLPDDILTDEKTVHLRHSHCDRPCLLLANTNDDQEQSLKDITSLGAGSLKEKIELWVDVASNGLDLPNEQLKYWQKALKGLQRANDCSLDQFANYVVNTRSHIQLESVPVINALGWALPALRLPRDSSYFESIPEKALGQANRWQQKYQQAVAKRSCFMVKQTPTGKPIEVSDLQKNFAKVKDEISVDIHPFIEAFIKSPSQWNKEAENLTQFEWETDNINSLFNELRFSQKKDLASLTLRFYEDEYPDSLTQEDIEYLETLRKRGTKEAFEEDKEFYDIHRNDLEDDRSLKTKWDKFVYGKPIECTDFLIGLTQVFERLFAQSDSCETLKKLVINTQNTSRKSKWLELNEDVGLYFCTRYRGIEKLTSPEIIWNTHWLFKYDELLKSEKDKNQRNYKKNTSESKSATAIKFYVELRSQSSSSGLISKTQLIWKCNPNMIGMELYDDLKRLQKNPFLISKVSRELVSKKGNLQDICLDNVATLMPAYNQDRGSLVNKYDKKEDLAKVFLNNLKQVINDKILSDNSPEVINIAWKKFEDIYQKAISAWISPEGISSPYLIQQCDAYKELLQTLLKYAHGDTNRVKLIQPVLELGCVKVERGKPAAIVVPWHPLRLASIAIKVRQISGLMKYILSSKDVDFGDSRLFFSDLCNEITHPYYPEVCLGYNGKQPLLLFLSDTLNDYSILEQPIRVAQDHTYDNPRVATTKLLQVMKQYLELLPHKKTNLSLILYECDSTRLPQSVVTQLSELQDNYNEARCEIILQHQNLEKLSYLYQQLIQCSETDPEAFMASEASSDFMARLRISVLSNTIPSSLSTGEKVADIIFLQDIISRQARIDWQHTPLNYHNNPEILKHVPSRWSRKRPVAKDELKSIAYLVCPSQPLVAQLYLDAIYSNVEGKDLLENEHFIPTRQISFQDEITRTVFETVHRLGEWVVNYDDLLDRRQLMNQGVNVIRYQQSRSNERNFLISSNTPLTLLQVLVKRRLEALNLGLDEVIINDIAQQFIEEANTISGDIVLRAAKSGKYASELIGIVLSKALLASELGDKAPVGWYFLDDYAGWLGQKEGRIADILVISPQIKDNERILKIIISEAKYIEANGLSDARKSSQNQLRDTVERITNALFVVPGRLDRDLWLSRLADLLLDGIQFNSTDSISVEEWRQEIINGTIAIDISGYSHVFVSGPNDTSVSNDQIPITKVDQCYQEVFSRKVVRQLILAIYKKTSLSLIREQLGHAQPWTVSNPKLPAQRVVWINSMLDTSVVSNSSIDDGVVDQEQLGISNNPDMKLQVNQFTDSWLEETVSNLRKALISYNLQAKVVGERLTPNAALVRFKGSDNLQIKDIENRRSQLLTTHGLNIINILGFPGEIVISVERPNREFVSLVEMRKQRKVNSKSGICLNLLIGIKEIDGELLYLNLGSDSAPHTLIAGATGSGKSILLRNIILDICENNLPELAKIYLIDAKQGTDYFPLEDLPHLVDGITTDPNESIKVFNTLVEEMEKRYKNFSKLKVKNVFSYNQKVADSEKLPILFIVHDEFADWMLIQKYKDEVSSAVQRLGVKARAAGIHLIFAAQRPDKQVFPVQLRDNLGNRLILRVESIGTSEIALGQKGAENLLGKGHLLARIPGEPDLIYAQVPFLSDDEFNQISNSIKNKLSIKSQ